MAGAGASTLGCVPVVRGALSLRPPGLDDGHDGDVSDARAKNKWFSQIYIII